ncbi:MAG: hypothetical protein M1838_000192 [Thelocarpon superellum]|nr:MAG: hypothetical protein M1838_000192 [Thelocarpon superellum]
MIRNAAQTPAIEATGKHAPGQLHVLVRSLEEIKSAEAAGEVLAEVQPDYVVWSAGAGGKGGPERTYAIDRDAARHFIAGAVAEPRVRKFLLVSAISSRRRRAPWWEDDEWALVERFNKALPHYYEAKVDADEYLTKLAAQRRKGAGQSEKGVFQDIILRPGGLSDSPATGLVSLGQSRTMGTVSRADVADVAARLLDQEDFHGWVDLVSGNELVESAVKRVVRDKVDAIEGEDTVQIYSSVT